MRLIFVLCVFAMFGAQVFGSAARFICDCGGAVKVVATSSCSGPHGQECHSDAAHEGDDSHDGSDGGDTKHHEQESRELAASTTISSHIVVPAPMVLAVLAGYFFFAPESSLAPREYLPDACGGPLRSIAVLRTVVLRI